MKALASLICCLCLLMLVQISASSQSDSASRVELQVKGVSLDSSLATVTRMLGAPRSRKQTKPAFSECTERRESRLTLQYPGMIVELIGDSKGRNFKVLSVSVSSPAWPVASGVATGNSGQAIVSRFGPPLRMENEGGLNRFVYFHKDNGGARFYFRDEKLVKVEWGLDL